MSERKSSRATTSEFIIKCINYWNEAPDILKEQIGKLSSYFRDHPRVRRDYEKWKLKNYEKLTLKGVAYEGREEVNKILLYASIFKNVSALDASKTKFYDTIVCYDERGEPLIKLEKKMNEGSHVKLFSGKFINAEKSKGWGTEKEVIIKLYESRDNIYTTAHEIQMYRLLGDPAPSMGINCYLWNIPVLLMKPMREIGWDDDECKVGIQVLKQLPALHVVSVHSDIKPQNIMCESTSWSSADKPKYRLIDFGGCARDKWDKNKAMWRRRTWSAKWTTQGRHPCQTNPKYDLLELGHTLTAFRYARLNQKKRHPRMSKRRFCGNLLKYMNYVMAIDDKELKCDEYGPHYRALIKILREPNVVDAEHLKSGGVIFPSLEDKSARRNSSCPGCKECDGPPSRSSSRRTESSNKGKQDKHLICDVKS